MLQLNEFIQIDEMVEELFEATQAMFTDEQIDAAEFFNLKWNPVSGQTELTVYDVNGEALASVGFDDPDIAIAVVEDLFELDEEDLLDLESYAWAGDVENRVYQYNQDDGTSDLAPE